MLLALVDARRPLPVPDDPPEEGAAYAALLERYRDAVVPWARDDDQGALITVVRTIAFRSFLDPDAGVLGIAE